MSERVGRYDITVTPHSRMERTHGGSCSRCGNSTTRTYYSDVTIHGERRALMIDTCGHCDVSREQLRHNVTGE